MKDKDATIIKVLSDIGYTDEPELTAAQEEQLARALDPEKQFLHDVERLFTPQIQEDAWDDAESRRTTPNPLPVAPSETLNQIFDVSDHLENDMVNKYRQSKEYANMPYPELSRKVREELGTVESVPISQIIGTEEHLDGQHLKALVSSKSTTTSSGVTTLIKSGGKYYVQDGNHRVAAAHISGDKQIKALVLDMDNI